MIDWHSHILPAMDDGSRDVTESLTLLRTLSEQGADTVVATPHFYANDESVSEFIQRREKSFEELKSGLDENMPEIVLGAEVRYYPGIEKLEGLKSLCIGNTGLLLLEMPMGRWTEYTIRELTNIANSNKVKLILAHIERYLPMQSSAVWKTLYESGIIMQVNGSFFYGTWTKRKALSFLQNGRIHLIGSDCHNTKTRAPHLDKVYEIIRKKLGDEIITQFDKYGKSLLI